MLKTPGSMSSIISWKWDNGLVPAKGLGSCGNVFFSPSDNVKMIISLGFKSWRQEIERNITYEIYIHMHVSKLKWPFFVYMKTAQFLLQTNHCKESSLESFTTTIHLQVFTNHRFLVETSGLGHDVSVSSRSGDAARARGFKGLRHKGHVCAVRNQLAKQPRWKTWRLVAQGANTISSEPEKSDKQMAQELASTTKNDQEIEVYMDLPCKLWKIFTYKLKHMQQCRFWVKRMDITSRNWKRNNLTFHLKKNKNNLA